ncbi:hypothetical protein MKW94_014819 [Papaver nudicaule]|uniref:PHD-type domain-containing protein n=1 Tax=Papaver nudicaule TaxID=74823 RepID=A0AA41RV00_PAPNU|nr:hypothetical protein [Papaver nudicaule]
MCLFCPLNNVDGPISVIICKINCCTLQLQAICQKCGESNDMGTDILVPCKMCKVPAKHRNCLDTAPQTDDTEPCWFCDGCVQKYCSSLNKFNYQPNQEPLLNVKEEKYHSSKT